MIAPARNTVLVVEDMDDVRRAIARVIRGFGFDVLQARDGTEAVKVYADHSASIVAVTLDLMMPETDGREALAMFSSFAPEVGIVVSSALPEPENLLGRKPGERGVMYLQKPYEAHELKSALNRVITEMAA